MGLLSKLTERFGALSDTKAAAYGRIEIPGEARIKLPAGRVKFTYHESRSPTQGAGDLSFDPPPGLWLVVIAPTGEQIRVKRGIRDLGHEIHVREQYLRAPLGRLKIAEPGEYVVRAGPDLPGATEPAVLVGY